MAHDGGPGGPPSTASGISQGPGADPGRDGPRTIPGQRSSTTPSGGRRSRGAGRTIPRPGSPTTGASAGRRIPGPAIVHDGGPGGPPSTASGDFPGPGANPGRDGPRTIPRPAIVHDAQWRAPLPRRRRRTIHRPSRHDPAPGAGHRDPGARDRPRRRPGRAALHRVRRFPGAGCGSRARWAEDHPRPAIVHDAQWRAPLPRRRPRTIHRPRSSTTAAREGRPPPDRRRSRRIPRSGRAEARGPKVPGHWSRYSSLEQLRHWTNCPCRSRFTSWAVTLM